MNRKNRIENILKSNFIEWEIEIIDNSKKHVGHNQFNGTQETHFQVTLKKKINDKQSRLNIHRKVNELLKDEFIKGMHALEIKILN